MDHHHNRRLTARRTDPARHILTSLWDTHANGGKSVTAGLEHTIRRYWWKCARGHRWQSRIADIANCHHVQSACPVCRVSAAVPSERMGVPFQAGPTVADNPTLLALFDRDENPTPPSLIPLTSGRIVAWKCPTGHTWKTPVTIEPGQVAASCPDCFRADETHPAPQYSVAAVGRGGHFRLVLASDRIPGHPGRGLPGIG